MERSATMKSTAVFVLAFTMAAGAQGRQDFSGTWVLERVEADPAQGPMGGGGRGGPGGSDLREEPGMTIVISQDESHLTIERRVGDRSITARHALDGSETVHNGPRGGVMKA